MNQTKTSALAALMLGVAALAGCGGGGGGGGDGDTPPPAPAVEPPAVTSVPPGDYADMRAKSAFDRLNEARRQAGIGLLEQNKLVDQAARNHSNYLALHRVVTHDEDPRLAGFTGMDQRTRVVGTGYTDFDSIGESAASWVYSSAVPDNAGSDLIDQLLGAPYHRNGLLDATVRYVGVGVNVGDGGSGAYITVNRVISNKNPQGAPNVPVWIWPPADSTNIPTTLLGEQPHPIPENNGAPAGYAASVHTNGGFRGVGATQCEMKDADGNNVNTKILSYGVDPNTSPNFAACLPRAPLKRNMRYTVTLTGVLTDRYSGKETPLVKTWSFTTGNKGVF